MKHMARPVLLVAVLSALLCVSALAAAPETEGIYDVVTETGVTCVPDESAKSFDRVTLAGPGSGEYLILVLSEDAAPTKDNIMYINQATASGSGVTFENVYPRQMAKGTYYMYITGGDRTFSNGRAATFQYNVPYKLGDVNDDGNVNANDALWVLQAAAGNRSLTGTQELAANVNKDSGVNANDALWILQAAAGNRVLE